MWAVAGWLTLWVGLSAVFSVQTRTSFLGEKGGVLFSLFALVIPLLSGAGLFLWTAHARTHWSQGVRRGWTLVGLGMIACAIGEAYLYANTYRTGIEPASPSFADFCFFFSYALPATGAWVMANVISKQPKRLLALDSMIVAVGSGALLWHFLLHQLTLTPLDGPYAKFFALSYPVADLILMWSMIVLHITAVHADRFKRETLILLTGTSIYCISDVLWSYLSALGLYRAGSVVDLGWSLGYSLMAVSGLALWSSGAILPGIGVRATQPWMKPATRQALSAALPLLLGGGLIAPVILSDIQDRKVELSTLFTLLALVCLASLRQFLSVLEKQREVERLNIELTGEVSERVTELEAHNQLSRVTNGCDDIPSILEQAAPLAHLACGGHPVCVILRRHASPSQEQGLMTWYGDAELEQLDLSEWLDDQSMFVASHQYPLDETRRVSALRVPLRSGNDVFGSLLVFRNGGTFNSDARSRIEATGLELAASMARVILYEFAVRAADRDYLTGLLNYRAMSRRFHDHFESTTPSDLGLIMLDIGNFKLFNDVHGHSMGDEVLRVIGKSLQEFIGSRGAVGRSGGDEFMILLPGQDLDAAYRFAEGIRDQIARVEIRVPGYDEVLPVEVNLGIASFPETSKNPYDVLSNADKNLAEAKSFRVAFLDRREDANALDTAYAESFTSVELILNAIENIDSYTRRHSHDVARFAGWLAEEMGESSEFVQRVRLAGLVHDVGKIAVPPHVLRKPSSLSDEEFELMKQHVNIGAIIANSFPGMSDVLPGVLYHHERFDGQGYPEGLVGEEIPYIARILSVADALSAMTTDRVYRKGMDLQVAAERLIMGAGTQFCPEATRAMVRALILRDLIATDSGAQQAA